MNTHWLARNIAAGDRARRRMELSGFTPNGHPLWNPFEAGTLIEGYPHCRDVLLLIPRRTRPAAYSKAGRLRITKPRAPSWDTNELTRIRKVYPRGTPEEIAAAFPRRSLTAVRRKASSMGIHRAPRPAKPTGNTLLDQILERAPQENYSRKELDIASAAHGFFTSRRWTRGRIDYSLLARATELLRGSIRVRWTKS